MPYEVFFNLQNNNKRQEEDKLSSSTKSSIGLTLYNFANANKLSACG